MHFDGNRQTPNTLTRDSYRQPVCLFFERNLAVGGMGEVSTVMTLYPLFSLTFLQSAHNDLEPIKLEVTGSMAPAQVPAIQYISLSSAVCTEIRSIVFSGSLEPNRYSLHCISRMVPVMSKSEEPSPKSLKLRPWKRQEIAKYFGGHIIFILCDACAESSMLLLRWLDFLGVPSNS